MNRIVIAVLLGLVAVGAGAVWAIGQFGGSPNPVVSVERPPIVREPDPVAVAAVVAPAQAPAAVQPAAPQPSRPAAITPKVEPKADPAPATPAPAVAPVTEPVEAPVVTPPATNTTPATTPPATTPRNPLDTLRSQVGKEIDKLKPPVANPTAPTSLAPNAQQPATPSNPPAAEPPAAPQLRTAEPPVSAQTAPATPAPTATARVAQPAAEQNVQTANVPGVTQHAAPVGLDSQFKARRVTYNRPPEKLALDKPVDVSLVVNATEEENAGREALEGFKGEIVERDVELSDTVSAQLTGVGFDIVSQTVERQRLSGRMVNRWQWRVTPTEVGEHTLMLEIFGYASGSLDAEPLDAYRDVIVVEVEQLDQIVGWARGVQPLFAVLAALAGIGSAAFAFLRFREEKKQTKAAQSKGSSGA